MLGRWSSSCWERAQQYEGRSEVAKQAGSGCGGWDLGIVLDVYSDVGADGAGTPAASTEYGWLHAWNLGGTDADSLEVWAEGAARVGGLPEEMDSTRAELLGAYAVLHKVRPAVGRHGKDMG